jgi:hypothetical protein
MLTLKECREIIGDTGKNYTDEELWLMLEFLSELASTIVNDLKRKEDEKTCGIDVAGFKR